MFAIVQKCWVFLDTPPCATVWTWYMDGLTAVLPKGEEDEESTMLASQLSCQIRGERNTSCNLRWARGARGARRWCIKEEFPSFFNGAGSIIDSLALTPKRLRWRRVERLTRSLSPGVFIGTLECGTGIVWKTPDRSLHAIAQLGVGAASSAWVLNCQTKIHPITPCFQNVFLLFQDFAPGIDNVSQEAEQLCTQTWCSISH